MLPVPMPPLEHESRQRILAAAEAARPREACGVVADGVAHELPNRAAGRRTFRIGAEDLAPLVQDLGGWRRVSAVWHSHPEVADDETSGSPLPSDADVANHPVGKVMIIVAGQELHSYGEGA